MSILKNLKYIAAILLVVILSSCKNDDAPPTGPEVPVLNLRGPYLGQQVPGMTPVKFAPHSSFIPDGNWFYHGSPAFSPDGNEVYFVKLFQNSQSIQIWYSRVYNGQWTQPERAPFSRGTFDNNPIFSTSNDTIYFKSDMPGGFIFRATRTSTGWSAPVALNIPMPAGYSHGHGFCITRNKTIYFEVEGGTIGNNPDLYRTRLVNGQYTQPESLGSTINTSSVETLGYVDPDERYILLFSNRPGGLGFHDIYCSRKNQDGSWGNPISVGNQINTNFEDTDPKITPDGKYLFFGGLRTGDLGYTPYWVDARILDPLRQ